LDSGFLENYGQVFGPKHLNTPFDHFSVDIDIERMELLLNLAWLLLALPAYLLWRGTRNGHHRRKFTALQCLLALAGMLVLLFPVVSATDDLRAMRAELEESPASKRSIGQAHGEKAPSSKSHTQPAIAHSSLVLVTDVLGWFQVPASQQLTASAPSILLASRGPPSSHLG
jgi:hypothetical protein